MCSNPPDCGFNTQFKNQICKQCEIYVAIYVARYRFDNNIVSQFCNVWLIIKTQIHMFSFYNVLMIYIAYCGHGAGFYIIVTQ